MEPGMIQYDELLGWKLNPGWSGNHHHYDYEASYTINTDGFRNQNISRVDEPSYSVIGDSFTFGLGVDDDETFVSIMNKKNSDNSTEIHDSILNYGVPGYSTDQQLILTNELIVKNRISKHVVLVLYLGNDIFDNMRAYPLQADHGKPYYKLIENEKIGQELALQNTPVPLVPKSAAARKDTISDIVLGKSDRNGATINWLSQLEISRRLGLFQRDLILTDDEMQTRFADSLKLLTALLDELSNVVNQNNGTLTMALLPGRSFVELPVSLSAQYQEFFRQKIVDSIGGKTSIKVIDLASHLRDLHDSGIDGLYFPNEGHLSKLGHQHVATYLSLRLSE